MQAQAVIAFLQGFLAALALASLVGLALLAGLFERSEDRSMALERWNHHLKQLRDAEERLLDRIRRRERVSRDVHQLHREQMTLGERLADRLAQFAGSWPFILIFLGLIALWVIFNSIELLAKPWDPYPFILLNLFLSLLAGLQAPVIMMSQNRQEARDRLRAEQDFEVNLKAELEIEQLHQKLDELRERRWRELLDIQERQIALLQEQLRLLQQGAPASAEAPALPPAGRA